MKDRTRGITVVLAALFALLTAARSSAHPAVPTVIVVDVSRVDGVGHVEARITHDVLAYALNDTSARVTDPQMHQLLKGPESDLAAALKDGRERFAGSFQLIADGKPIPFKLVKSPTLEDIKRWKADNPTLRLPCKMDFVVEANLPQGTSKLSVRLPPVLGDAILSVERPKAEPIYIPLSAGEVSPAVDVSMVTAPSGEVAQPAGGEEQTQASKPEGNPVSLLGIAWRYLKLGYNHIIPEGADHALFVLGLFLLTPRTKALMWQITAFTIAHSVTLTLATLRIVQISPSIVEPTIALTIAFIAIENLMTTKVHLWRPAVAFTFGLVHGLGFASALMSVGLPVGQLATGLIAFNVGVECGHMTVLACAFAALGWWRSKPWYRQRIAIPLSIVIAAIALFWMVSRIFG